MNKVQKIVVATCTLGYFIIFQAIDTQKNIVANQHQIGFCIFKKLTSFPCPSCGSTRSVLLLCKGLFLQSINTNPIGLIIFLYLIIAPILLVIDLVFNKNLLSICYLKLGHLLKQPPIFITILTLVILNWVWNISKHL